MKLAALFLVLACFASNAQTVRVLKFSEALEFRMGKVVSKRIVHPEMGARQITLNYSPTVAGHEFSQHVHDFSDDTIVILEGEADLRQGNSLRRFQAGQSVFVPAGQIHGTITRKDGTEMISFQTPPDMALYTGSRDSSRADAPPPKGVITPGAVKFLSFSDRDGLFVHPGMGAKRIAAGYQRLEPGESFSETVAAGVEAVVFVRKGPVQLLIQGKPQRARERDAVFVQGPAKLKLRNVSGGQAILIHALAPPLGATKWFELEALADREHEERAEPLAWRGPFDPEAFSLERINASLRERSTVARLRGRPGRLWARAKGRIAPATTLPMNAPIANANSS